jgi:hypothetical protein
MVAPETMDAFLAMVRLVDKGSFRNAEIKGTSSKKIYVSAAPMRVYQDLQGKITNPLHFSASRAHFPINGHDPDKTNRARPALKSTTKPSRSGHGLCLTDTMPP